MYVCIYVSNGICVSGATALASYLIQSPRLKYLMLSANRVGDEGASAIAEVKDPLKYPLALSLLLVIVFRKKMIVLVFIVFYV